MKNRDVLAIFNRGRISRLGVARTDVARVALSAEEQTNWIPKTFGPMMVRPGLQYLGAVSGPGRYIPFIFSNKDTAILELSALQMRVWEDGDTLVVRTGSTSSVTNGNFTSNLNGWTDADEGASASVWSGGYMQLIGTGYTSARRRQSVVCVAGEETALRIVIERGPVLLRIGTSAGLDDIFRQAILRTGTHSIAFTPAVTAFHIEFASSLTYPVLVDSCTVENDGVLSLPTVWDSAANCRLVRWQQSGDVVFCACSEFQQQRIERRPNNSWSVVKFEANDGPFLTENVEKITITPSGLTGLITLTATKNIFTADHVGALFRIASQGQRVEADLVADLTYTDEIRVTGVEAGRIFTIIRAGVWVGTLSLQRSIGEPGTWVNVASYTTNATVTHDDELDNSVAYYRIGFNTGGWTSGTAEVTLTFATGSITGTARVTGYTSETVVDAVVLDPMGETTGSEIWWEGAWSDENGWPEAVAISEGRLWWSGQGRNYGSVPDGFTSYDPFVEGDSQPIDRRCGEGAVNRTNWMLPLQNLIVGTDGAEISVRSTSFEEPVTPSNYNAKARSTKGSEPLPACQADGAGYFIGRTGNRVFELAYDPGSYGYVAQDMLLLCPEIGESRFSDIGVQQSPDLRLHVPRDDGTVAVMIRDPAENVLAWVDVETDGEVEGVVVLPGRWEDRVYYCVKRVIDGNTVRYHERMARDDQARGGASNRMSDSFIVGAGPVTGLDHLEGEEVTVWGDGKARANATVVSGVLDGRDYDVWCVGLPYEARYRSAKLAGQTSLGLSLTQKSRINAIGLILADTHAQGVHFGQDFDTLDDLPGIEDGVLVDVDALWTDYDKGMVEFPGDWSNDSRVCLTGQSPMPCTVLGVVLNVTREDHE